MYGKIDCAKVIKSWFQFSGMKKIGLKTSISLEADA